MSKQNNLKKSQTFVSLICRPGDKQLLDPNSFLPHDYIWQWRQEFSFLCVPARSLAAIENSWFIKWPPAPPRVIISIRWNEWGPFAPYFSPCSSFVSSNGHMTGHFEILWIVYRGMWKVFWHGCRIFALLLGQLTRESGCVAFSKMQLDQIYLCVFFWGATPFFTDQWNTLKWRAALSNKRLQICCCRTRWIGP